MYEQATTNASVRYKDIDFTPTDEMAREVEQGLSWWRKERRGGNEMALARAWRIQRKAPLSPDVVRRTAAHMGLLEGRKLVQGWNFGESGFPSDSRIIWSLMGGDAGFDWARAIVGQLDAADSGLQVNRRQGAIAADGVRVEALNGRTYVVAPVVALVPGVVNGFLVTEEELSRDVGAWNGRPITLRHPHIGNQYVTANDPAIAARQAIGAFYNVRFADGKLKGEIWLDPSLCAQVGDEAMDVFNRLREGEHYEVSTGYFCAVEEEEGTFGGKPYEGRQTGLIPDHLAVLPDKLGACSWADGCGTPRVNVTAVLDLDRILVANAAQDYSDDVMVAFFLREQAVGLHSHITDWPQGSQPTPLNEYHVTLAYLGKKEDLPSTVNFNQLGIVLSQYAQFHAAFPALVSGIGRFSAEDGAEVEPVYLSVDSPEMQAMRAELLGYLDSLDIRPGSAHGFTPHITLGYVPKDADLTLRAPAPTSLAVDSIALAWGGNVTVFPLQGQVYAGAEEEVPTVNTCSCKEKKSMEGNEGVQEAAAPTAPAVTEVEAKPSAADQLVEEFGGVEMVRAALLQMQTNARAEVEGLVGVLAANSRCAFGADELRLMPVETLRKLEASLRPADYSTKPAANSRADDGAVQMYGQTWKPYQTPVIESK